MDSKAAVFGVLILTGSLATILAVGTDASITGMFYRSDDNSTNQTPRILDLDNSTLRTPSGVVRLPSSNRSYSLNLNSTKPNTSIALNQNETHLIDLNSTTTLKIKVGNRTFNKEVILENTKKETTQPSNKTSNNNTSELENRETDAATSQNQNDSETATPSNQSAPSITEESSNTSAQNQTTASTETGNTTETTASDAETARNNTDNRTQKPSKAGMAEVRFDGRSFHIFRYEASKADSTETSGADSPMPVSRRGVEPWNDISRKEASEACRRKGKEYRLPTREEWRAAYEKGVGGNTYLGSSGSFSSSETCSLSTSSTRNERYCLTGTGPDSWSTEEGVADMKGNLWEWTSTTETRELGGRDTKLAVRAGGKWSTGEVSNLFIADRKPDHSSTDIGFRCIRED